MIIKISEKKATEITHSSHSSSESFTSNSAQLQSIPYSNMLSNVAKNAHATFIYEQYFYFLKEYLSIHKLTPYTTFLIPLINPHSNFFAHQNCLYYIHDMSIDFSLPTRQLFTHLNIPCSPDGIIEENLIFSLKNYIKTFSIISSAERKVRLYLHEHPDMTSYYNRIQECGFLLDNNLYFPFNETYGFVNPNELLHIYNNIKLDNKNNIRNYPSNYADMKKILNPEFISIAKSTLSNRYYTKSALNPYYLVTTPPAGLNKLVYNIAYYDKKLQKFSCTTWKAHLEGGDDILYAKEKSVSPCFSFEKHAYTFRYANKLNCSEFIAEYLYSLTNGNLTTLNSLAKLFASMASPEAINAPIYAINYDASKISLDKLKMIFPLSVNYNLRSLSDIILQDNIPNLISYRSQGYSALGITDCKPLNNFEKIHTLESLIKGSPITCNNKYLGKIKYINTLPLIFFPKSEAEVNFLTNNFPTEIINLTHLSQETIPDSLSSYDYEWLRINFMLYGISLHATSNKHSLNTLDATTPIPTIDSLLEDFIVTCCIVTNSEEDYTFNTDLYEAYARFLDYRHQLDSKGEKSFTKYFNMHINQNHNRYPNVLTNKQKRDPYEKVRKCTRGILLKENYQNELVPNVSNENSYTFESWHNMLKQIDRLVPDELYSY